MPSKTKNRRAKGTRRHRKGTMRQRGGGYFSDLSDKFFGPSDSVPTTSSSSLFNMPDLFKSDPSGKSWWERLTSSSPTVIETTTNPMQPANAYTTSDYPSTTSSTTGLSNSEFMGGKKSKSRSKHRHKHTKSCSK
jgi:hypothetical protein